MVGGSIQTTTSISPRVHDYIIWTFKETTRSPNGQIKWARVSWRVGKQDVLRVLRKLMTLRYALVYTPNYLFLKEEGQTFPTLQEELKSNNRAVATANFADLFRKEVVVRGMLDRGGTDMCMCSIFKVMCPKYSLCVFMLRFDGIKCLNFSVGYRGDWARSTFVATYRTQNDQVTPDEKKPMNTAVAGVVFAVA